jgi:hypothetical protein
MKWRAGLGCKRRVREMTALRLEALIKCVAKTLPRPTTTPGEPIERTRGINPARSAIIKFRARLCLDYRLPKALPRKLDPSKQEAFRGRLLFPCPRG